MGFGSFLKGLGKGLLKVAPIATSFIPGVGPIAGALLGAGTGAASGAITGGGKGALIGGLMGAGGGALGGAANAGRLGNFGKSAVGQALLGNGSPGSGSLMQQLLSGDTLNAAGQGLGAIGQTQAHNRGVALDAMLASDDMKLAADRERRAAESDMLKKVQITSYLKDGGFKDPGTMMSANGKPFTKFDFGTRPASEAEIAMASGLQDQMMDRMKNPIQLSDYASKMEPGKMETALNWLGPLLTTLGTARGAGKYNAPQASTQTPEAPPVPFTPSVTNSATAGQNPMDRIRFGNPDFGFGE